MDFRPRLFVLRDVDVRTRAARYVYREAPEGCEVLVTPERMTDSKRARFHAVCNELARSGLPWGGVERTLAEWKVLLISGHSVATGTHVELIEGLEGELVDIRESTTRMSKQRGNSLIQYAEAYCLNNGVELKELAGR